MVSRESVAPQDSAGRGRLGRSLALPESRQAAQRSGRPCSHSSGRLPEVLDPLDPLRPILAVDQVDRLARRDICRGRHAEHAGQEPEDHDREEHPRERQEVAGGQEHERRGGLRWRQRFAQSPKKSPLTRSGEFPILAASRRKVSRPGVGADPIDYQASTWAGPHLGTPPTAAFLRATKRQAAGKDALRDASRTSFWRRCPRCAGRKARLSTSNRSRKSDVSSAPLGRGLSGGLFLRAERTLRIVMPQPAGAFRPGRPARNLLPPEGPARSPAAGLPPGIAPWSSGRRTSAFPLPRRT